MKRNVIERSVFCFDTIEEADQFAALAHDIILDRFDVGQRFFVSVDIPPFTEEDIEVYQANKSS